MKINIPCRKPARAYIILMVMCMCAASALILAGVLSYTYTTANLNMRSNELSMCQTAAEAAAEKAYANLAYDFEAAGLQQVSNNIANNAYRRLCPNTNESSFFGQFHFFDPSAPTNANDYVYVGYLTNYSGPLPTQYTNEFASSNSIIYRIVANANLPNSFASDVVGTAQEDVLLALVPINTYAIFYNGELEFSDCADMVISGRTHSNADICTGTSASLTFNGAVTCSSVIQSPGRGGYTYGFNEGTTYNSGCATDVVSISLSIPMTNTHSMIEIQDPTVISPTSAQGQMMEYYEAQVVLIVTNSPSASSGTNPAVYLTLQNSYNQTVPANDPSPYVFLTTNATTALMQTNMYASCVTTGVTSKFSVGGGDAVCHSRPVAPHGFGGASGPYLSDHKQIDRTESDNPRPESTRPPRKAHSAPEIQADKRGSAAASPYSPAGTAGKMSD